MGGILGVFKCHPHQEGSLVWATLKPGDQLREGGHFVPNSPGPMTLGGPILGPKIGENPCLWQTSIQPDCSPPPGPTCKKKNLVATKSTPRSAPTTSRIGVWSQKHGAPILTCQGNVSGIPNSWVDFSFVCGAESGKMGLLVGNRFRAAI